MVCIQWAGSAREALDAYLAYVAAEGGDVAAVGRRIFEAVGRLAFFPESSPAFGDARRLVVRGLSVSCFYDYDGSVVRITYFRHDKQRPLQ